MEKNGEGEERATASASLDVLHLLAKPLELDLHADDELRNSGILGFGAERIRLAYHFLQKEVEPPAHGLAGARHEHALDLIEVAAQPRELLGEIALVDDERELELEP